MHSWICLPLYSFDMMVPWSMPGWGNGEPGSYTYIIPMPRDMCFLLTFANSSQFGTCVTKFVVTMTLLVFLTPTKMQLVGAIQHHCHLTQCLLSPSSMLVECKNTNPTSTFLGAVRRSWLPEDQWGHKSVPLGPRSPNACLLVPPFFLAASSSYYKTQMLHFSMYAFALGGNLQ